MITLIDWLDGKQDFAVGVELYKKFGGKAFYITMFEKAGPTEFNKGKLVTELQRIAGDQPKPEPIKPVSKSLPSAQIAAPSLKPTPDAKADNRRYLDLVRKKANLYVQLNILMNDKRHMPEGEKLRQCAFAIINTHQQITETWHLIDYYQEHECFPGKDEVQRDDATQIQYLRQSISRANDRLKQPGCRNKEKTLQLIAAKQAELEKLLNKLSQ